MFKKVLKFTQAVAVSLAVLTVAVMGSNVFAGDKAGSVESPTVVNLHSDGIYPASVTVKQGNTIVWHNGGKGDVKIVFTTRIGIACTAPVNFYADLLGNYESTLIHKGGTASICMIDTGTYEYEVRRLSDDGSGTATEYVVKGKIVVEKKKML